jgi:methylphosphotriester-DNA--protein-cysteine methyltransferase
VIAALKMLESEAVRHQRRKLEELARVLPEQVRPERLGELIKEQTGFWFTDWRTGFLLRSIVFPLLITDLDIKQIVRPLVAFKDLGHFDHEFHRFFGLAPTKFRQLSHAHG